MRGKIPELAWICKPCFLSMFSLKPDRASPRFQRSAAVLGRSDDRELAEQ